MTLPKQFHKGFLNGLWRIISTYPGVLIGVGLAFAVLSALAATLFLQLNFDQNRLVSPEVPFFKRYLENLENFGDQEYLFVVITTGGTEEGKKRAIQFAESLAQRLRKQAELIRAVYYRISPEDFGDGVLLFASPKEARMLTRTIVSLAPFIQAWLEDGSLAGFLDQISNLLSNQQGNLLDLDPSLLGRSLIPLGELLKELHETVAGRVHHEYDFDFTGSTMQYFFTSNGRLLIMRLLADKDFSTPDVIGEPLDKVRKDLEATRIDFPDVKAGLTGRPVLQADEMQTTDRDMTRAAVLAFLLVGLLFMVVLHGWLRPLLVLVCLVVASAWTFGFATAAVGELNLLSMVFALVLVGIGVDFGVHMVMRYVEAQKGGLGVEDAVNTALLKTGPGIILAGATSVCAFFSVLFSDFLGLAEFGLIGGSGILLSLLAMLSVLPAMLLLAGRKSLFPSSQPRVVAMSFMERLSARPGRLLLILVAVSLLGLPGLFKVQFNYNLLKLQATGLESVAYEKLLIEASDESTWYAIFTARALKDVKRVAKTVKTLPSVGTVSSILDFIPEAQAQKSALYAQAAEALNHVSPPRAGPPIPDPNSLTNALLRLSTALEALEEKLFGAGAGTELALLDQSLEHVLNSMELLERDPAKAALLADLQARLHKDIVESVERLKHHLAVESVTPEDLPLSLRSIYVGKDGRSQIKVTPKEDIWNFGNLERFVSDLRRVDPEVSGVPITVFETARLVQRTFLSAAGLTVVLVSLILWFYSRSMAYVLFTLLPLGVGMLWLLELMGWLGLSFNLANFFAIPILIAIGVDGGVHLQARWAELQGRSGLFSTSTPTAVALSFTTTMIGFGGLLFAHHRGLASLGAVMVLGSLTCLMACLLVLPAALKLFGTSGTGRNQKELQCPPLVVLLALLVFLFSRPASAGEHLDFAVIQPGQPGNSLEAQPVMDHLAAYIQKKLGPHPAVKGIYFNELDKALDFLRNSPPAWGIVCLGFYTEHAHRFPMTPIVSTRPGGLDKEIWHLAVAKDAPESWQALRGKISGTMLFERDAAACLMFGTRADRLPFQIAGTLQPLRSLRSTSRRKTTGTVLSRIQYDAMKALPWAQKIKIIHKSEEIPTSPVIWFGARDKGMSKVSEILTEMRDDPEAETLLRLLQTDGFGPPDAQLPRLRIRNDARCFD